LLNNKNNEKVASSFYKPKVYSGFHENLFNNKKYSDLLLKFENSSTTIHAHKSILASSSDTFKDLILKDENVNEITLNEDDKTFSEFIKFLYTGCFDLKKIGKKTKMASKE